MSHLARIVRSSTIAACTAVATTAAVGGSGTSAFAASGPPPLECEPIACAAAYIGVPQSTLAAEVVNDAGPAGSLGLQVVVDQLDAAMARQLSAMAPTSQAGVVVMSYWTVIARHDAIRDALSDQLVTALCPGCVG